MTKCELDNFYRGINNRFLKKSLDRDGPSSSKSTFGFSFYSMRLSSFEVFQKSKYGVFLVKSK